MKKFISLILALVLTFSCIPTNAFAASDTEACAYSPYSSNASLLEVVKDNAPIRSGAGEKHGVVIRCAEGAVLEKTGTTINRYLNKWHKVNYRDPVTNKCYSGFIFSERVEKHSHAYDSFTYDGITYKYCNCGKIAVRASDRTKMASAIQIADASLGMMSVPMDALTTAGITAGGLALCDGPFIPVGDLLGIGLLITVAIMADTGVLPSVDAVEEVWEDVVSQYDNKDVCSTNSYRKVIRVGEKLQFADKDCLTAYEAIAWVSGGGDVWCENYDTAYQAAKTHTGGCFSEIHGNGKKDYYYHFHLGQCVNGKHVVAGGGEQCLDGKHVNKKGGHIFYGGSALTGSRPS